MEEGAAVLHYTLSAEEMKHENKLRDLDIGIHDPKYLCLPDVKVQIFTLLVLRAILKFVLFGRQFGWWRRKGATLIPIKLQLQGGRKDARKSL